ncbi:MAG: DUF1501 domain-containing protein [SAR202 cluster bacterium]|jgi:uncharacterized protein (DUF1501 family)|nr:DUF1501 domain-containing protein [SAR202 cluster bacterium]
MGSGNGQNGGTRDRNLVVLQLGGGNDYLNTIVPYENGLYYDNRPTIAHDPDKILKINDEIGFRPDLEPIKRLWDEGKVAIIHGIGYPEPNRSHFRSMDIWHTAMPEEIGTEGWLGRVIRDIDPTAENVLTGVNFGRGLPRSMGLKGVPVASVGNLETYGLFPDMEDEYLRKFAIDSFAKMYGGKGKDAVMDFLGQTGASALKGADMLGTAPGKYKSSIEYGDNPIGNDLKNAATVMFAGLGTRIFHTSYGSFDTHSGEVFKHDLLWQDTARAVGDFWDDIAEHGMDDDTVIFMFSEFGRRIKDNGSGTDHGSGGVAFLIGNSVRGGMYGEYPSLEEKDQIEGDLRYNNDFRMTYSSILEQWLEIEAAPIVNGRFEQFDLIKN